VAQGQGRPPYRGRVDIAGDQRTVSSPHPKVRVDGARVRLHHAAIRNHVADAVERARVKEACTHRHTDTQAYGHTDRRAYPYRHIDGRACADRDTERAYMDALPVRRTRRARGHRCAPALTPMAQLLALLVSLVVAREPQPRTGSRTAKVVRGLARRVYRPVSHASPYTFSCISSTW
jgi:hypothetical protein